MTCCFIGHRRIEQTPELKELLAQTICSLIELGVTDFIFGDHSAFDTLCYGTISALQEKYPEIRRIHFRKDYQEISESERQFFVKGYEDSICPDGVASAGKASYIERNQAMIRKSDYCVFYYDEHYQPPLRKESKHSVNLYQPKSGTRAAYEYALFQKKKVINLFGCYVTEIS